MTGNPPPHRKRLGELLIAAGVVDEARVNAALGEQKKWGGKLGRTLVEMGFVDEDSMMRALSRQLNLQAVDLDSVALPSSVVQLLRVDLCERYGIFPVGGDPKTRTLQLATSDPTNTEAMQELSVATNSKIVNVVATGSAIDRAIRRYYYGEAAVAARPVAVGAVAPAAEVPPPPRPPPSASLDLDELLGNVPPRPSQPRPPAGAAQPGPELGAMKKELAAMKEQLENLEKINASQVRAMRGLLELLIESGLVTRDEYLVKVNRSE